LKLAIPALQAGIYDVEFSVQPRRRKQKREWKKWYKKELK
jgi:hypothetical protein